MMLPIEALMQEHRIIERMIPPFKKELARMETSRNVNVKFIEKAVDFIRTYADHCHHGKEEGVLFRELRKKPLTAELAAMMNQLIEDHAYSRRTTSSLVEASVRYAEGDAEAWRDVGKSLNDLCELYPRHIRTENEDFFPASMEYFTPEEREAMMSEFWDFDKKLIHEKYAGVVGELEKTAAT